MPTAYLFRPPLYLPSAFAFTNRFLFPLLLLLLLFFLRVIFNFSGIIGYFTSWPMEEKIGYEVDSLAAKILIETVGFFAKTFSFLASLASDPLFSAVVAIHSLILLYLPRVLSCLIFSPVLISSGVLLSTLLRLGAIQIVDQEHHRKSKEQQAIDSSPVEGHRWVKCETKMETKKETITEACSCPNLKPFFSLADSILEWNVRAPLEVICEGYEGEDEEESRQMGIDKMPSLSLYYPESDSDSSSDDDFSAIEDCDSLGSTCFRWDEEDREGLIEIALDGNGTFSHVEEENLIEIDIFSPTLFGAQVAN